MSTNLCQAKQQQQQHIRAAARGSEAAISCASGGTGDGTSDSVAAHCCQPLHSQAGPSAAGSGCTEGCQRYHQQQPGGCSEAGTAAVLCKDSLRW